MQQALQVLDRPFMPLIANYRTPTGGATGDKPTCDPAVPGLDVSSFLVDDGEYVAPENQQAPFKLDNSSGWHDIGCYGITDKVGVFDGNVSYVDSGLTPAR